MWRWMGEGHKETDVPAAHLLCFKSLQGRRSSRASVARRRHSPDLGGRQRKAPWRLPVDLGRVTPGNNTPLLFMMRRSADV